MKVKDRTAIIALILLVMATGCLGCSILYQNHYDKLSGQIVALILGLVLSFAVVCFRRIVFNPRCIVVFGIIIFALCVTAVLQTPYPWIKAEVFIGGGSMRPGYYIFPVFALLGYFLCNKKYNPAWLMAAVLILAVLVVVMIQPEIMRVLLFMGSCMAFERCVTTSDRRWPATFGCALGLAAMYYASYPLIAQPHDVFWKMDLDITRDRLALLMSAPWVGESGGDWRLVYCCDETVLYALIHQGRLMVIAIVAIAVAMTALTVWLVRRVHNPARKTVMLGCGASLVAPMWLSFAQFAPCHIGHYSFPWLTPSVSLWTASFISLGFMISSLVDECEANQHENS